MHELLKKIKRNNLKVSSYDRRKEPTNVKKKENSSIPWGIKSTIKNSKSPYDAIYHKGDLGKEPMIIIFGQEPEDVVRKISLIV